MTWITLSRVGWLVRVPSVSTSPVPGPVPPCPTSLCRYADPTLVTKLASPALYQLNYLHRHAHEFCKLYHLVLFTSVSENRVSMNLRHSVPYQNFKILPVISPRSKKKAGGNSLHNFHSSNNMSLKTRFCFPFGLLPRNKSGGDSGCSPCNDL